MTSASTAQDVLISICELAFADAQRDLMRVIRTIQDGLSSEAFVDLLSIGNALPEFRPDQYEVAPLSEGEEEARFRLSVTNSKTGVTRHATVTMRPYKGAWRVEAVKMPGIRE